ncbi:GH3 auxin-responsive promoter family protein, partial [Hydrotalea sp.]|uniref:GH3 family domain-containing protein n=1 Tax=Hydrotalea sp. TaxID=2881279 RepID=UPI00258A7A99
LELYLHGGVSFVPYQEQFKKLIGKNIFYLDLYNASEGFFAAQNDAQEEGMLLFLDYGIFYEFMPVEEYGKQTPITIGLKQVEIGKNYAPVISTNGGLWRYLTGDTIQFTSIFPFKIKVSGRLKHFINAFGEELIVDNSDKAVAIAAQKTNSIISEYTAAPVYFNDEQNGAHEWLIEFERPPQNMEHFAFELDCALKSLNSDYEAKRQKDIALRKPIVHAVQKNIFNGWLRNKGKLGGQHKVPRLSNNRIYVDELLQLMREEFKQ